MNLKYRRIVVPRHGGPDVLQVVEEEIPEPRAGKVRVKVLAAGVSAYDIMIRSSYFPGFPRVPFTPGVDVVGVADKLGEGVSTIRQEQTVVASVPSGGYAEFICIPASELVSVPAGVNPAKAVCVVANYLTAHLILHQTAKIRSGERILVHGAAGGVGTALLELGRLAGLEMYGTASARNHELVSSLGAIPVDYRNEDFVECIRNLTGDGVDAVFDPVGGARQLWRSYRTLRKGGRLVWFGVAATAREGMRVIPLSLLIQFLLMLIPDGKHTPSAPHAGQYAQKHNTWYRETLSEILGLLATKRINPIVAERIPLVEAARAHELLERGGHAGKVVLVTGE